MRKRMKLKRRVCSLCKPNKMGWERRWKAKEFDALKRAEHEMRVVSPTGGWWRI